MPLRRPALVAALLLGLFAPAAAAPAEPPAPESPSIFGRMPAEARSHYAASAWRLWEARAPQARGDTAADVPLLYPVLPAGPAQPRGVVIVLPGGGYRYHSAAEAFPIAEHFRDAGYAAFVLQYRLLPYESDVALLDVQRAVRLLRTRAAEWHLDPQHIAVIGFSAGGHLGANLSTHGDDGRPGAPDPVERASCRIQSALLFYPSIFRHRLQRADPANRDWPRLLARDGLHRLVDARTPPTFLMVGYDDSKTPYENCLAYATQLHAAGVRFELHILGAGEHGSTVREGRRAIWLPLADAWLATCGFAPASAP